MKLSIIIQDQSAAIRLLHKIQWSFPLLNRAFHIRKVLNDQRRHLEFNIHIGPNAKLAAVPSSSTDEVVRLSIFLALDSLHYLPKVC
jgi:hypothetical protein